MGYCRILFSSLSLLLSSCHFSFSILTKQPAYLRAASVIPISAFPQLGPETLHGGLAPFRNNRAHESSRRWKAIHCRKSWLPVRSKK